MRATLPPAATCCHLPCRGLHLPPCCWPHAAAHLPLPTKWSDPGSSPGATAYSAARSCFGSGLGPTSKVSSWGVGGEVEGGLIEAGAGLHTAHRCALWRAAAAAAALGRPPTHTCSHSVAPAGMSPPGRRGSVASLPKPGTSHTQYTSARGPRGASWAAWEAAKAETEWTCGGQAVGAAGGQLSARLHAGASFELRSCWRA